jgi:hypothetical protein
MMQMGADDRREMGDVGVAVRAMLLWGGIGDVG